MLSTNFVKSMSRELHIAVSCNDRYVSGALVTMAGVAVYANEETRLSFHVFTEEVKPESIVFMRETLARLHANSALVEHICDEQLLSGLPYWASSRMAAVRCFYADLMPEVDWCLYLDCDVLYLASVEEHFSYCDNSVYACVVQEESTGTRLSECTWIKKACGADVSDEKYFNSGVVLFNFKKMRENNIPNRLLQFFKDHPDVPSPDQDALNATFGGCVKMLPAKYNRLQIYMTDDRLKERPVIHYVDGNPWLPKFKEVASGRFWLWHRFADKYVYGQYGESCRRCFSPKMLFAKKICYNLLKLPIIGAMVAKGLEVIGLTANGLSWRKSQVQCDVSMQAIREAVL